MNITQNSALSPNFEWFWKLILNLADFQYHSVKTEWCGLQHNKQSDAEIMVANRASPASLLGTAGGKQVPSGVQCKTLA